MANEKVKSTGLGCLIMIIVMIVTSCGTMFGSNTEDTERERERDSIVQTEYMDVDVLTDTSQSIGIGDDVDRFSFTMAKEIEKRHQQFDNGVVLRKEEEFYDVYGNKSDFNYGMVIYLSQETLDKINYETWPYYKDYYLFNIADNYWIHQSIVDELELEIPKEKGNKSEAPPAFRVRY